MQSFHLLALSALLLSWRSHANLQIEPLQSFQLEDVKCMSCDHVLTFKQIAIITYGSSEAFLTNSYIIVDIDNGQQDKAFRALMTDYVNINGRRFNDLNIYFGQIDCGARWLPICDDVKGDSIYRSNNTDLIGALSMIYDIQSDVILSTALEYLNHPGVNSEMLFVKFSSNSFYILRFKNLFRNLCVFHTSDEDTQKHKITGTIYNPHQCSSSATITVDQLESCRGTNFELTTEKTQIHTATCHFIRTILLNVEDRKFVRFDSSTSPKNLSRWVDIALQECQGVVLALEEYASLFPKVEEIMKNVVKPTYNQNAYLLILIDSASLQMFNRKHKVSPNFGFVVNTQAMGYVGLENRKQSNILSFVHDQFIMQNSQINNLIWLPSVSGGTEYEMNVLRYNKDLHRKSSTGGVNYLVYSEKSAETIRHKISFAALIFIQSWNYHIKTALHVVQKAVGQLPTRWKSSANRLVIVDCFDLNKFCMEEGIFTYPTILFYKKGERSTFSSNTISVASVQRIFILNCMNEMKVDNRSDFAEMLAELSPIAELTLVAVDMHLDNKTNQIFLEAASSIRQTYPIVQTERAFLSDEHLVDVENNTTPFILAISHFNGIQKVRTLKNLTEVQQLQDFLHDILNSNVRELSWEKMDAALQTRPMIIFFANNWTQELDQVSEQVIQRFKDRASYFSADVKNPYMVKLLRFYGGHHTPAMAIVNKIKSSYDLYEGTMTNLNLLEEWTKQVLDNQLPSSAFRNISTRIKTACVDHTDCVYRNTMMEDFNIDSMSAEDEENMEQLVDDNDSVKKMVDINADINKIRDGSDDLKMVNDKDAKKPLNGDRKIIKSKDDNPKSHSHIDL